MKQILIALMMLALLPGALLGEDTGLTLSGKPKIDIYRLMFTDVETCHGVSDAYSHIAVGSSLDDVRALTDTPLPQGLYWPEYPQNDGSVITQRGAVLPPDEWGTNYIARVDGQSQKGFYFFHDTETVTRIIHARLNLTTEPPRGPVVSKDALERDHQKPIGPLIMMEKE